MTDKPTVTPLTAEEIEAERAFLSRTDAPMGMERRWLATLDAARASQDTDLAIAFRLVRDEQIRIAQERVVELEAALDAARTDSLDWRKGLRAWLDEEIDEEIDEPSPEHDLTFALAADRWVEARAALDKEPKP